MSLAEVLVAVSISMLVMVVLGTTAVIAVQTLGTTATRVDNVAQADLATATASKMLRTAVMPQQLEDTECVQSTSTAACDEVAVLGATATEVRFYGNLGRSAIGPTLVVLSVREERGVGVLRETLVDPISLGAGRYRFCDPATTGCATRRRVVARSLVLPSPPVFAYYDVDGALMALPAGGGLTQSQRARISSIDVTVTVQTRPGQQRWPSFTSLTRVRLPNVEINLQLEDDA